MELKTESTLKRICLPAGRRQRHEVATDAIVRDVPAIAARPTMEAACSGSSASTRGSFVSNRRLPPPQCHARHLCDVPILFPSSHLQSASVTEPVNTAAFTCASLITSPLRNCFLTFTAVKCNNQQLHVLLMTCLVPFVFKEGKTRKKTNSCSILRLPVRNGRPPEQREEGI